MIVDQNDYLDHAKKKAKNLLIEDFLEINKK